MYTVHSTPYMYMYMKFMVLLLCKSFMIVDSSVYGLKRELLLALQWMNFEHHPSDLQLLFTGSLYDNITALSGVVSTLIAQDPAFSAIQIVLGQSAPSSDSPPILNNRLEMASLLAKQLLTIRVG